MPNFNTGKIELDKIDKAIINQYQGGVPFTQNPYAEMAEKLNISEQKLLSRLKKLLDNKVLTRFGPLYDAEKIGGYFLLCAMKIPKENFDKTAIIINEFDEVAHNYERDDTFNMWFVLAIENKNEVESIIKRIESATDYKVYRFPKKQEFFIGLKLEA